MTKNKQFADDILAVISTEHDCYSTYLLGDVVVQGVPVSRLRQELRGPLFCWSFRGDAMDFEQLVEDAGFTIAKARNLRGQKARIVTLKGAR